MGCQFQLGIVSENAQHANKWLEEGVQEISRLETLLTEFDQSSYTSKINAAAGNEFVEVPAEVYQLIERSVHISKLTKGHFDISVGPLKQLYKFKNNEFQLPKRRIIGKALQQIGYNNIILNSEEKSVKLRKAGMKISFAAIGKGYAADVVLAKWKANDIQGGFVNASGDLTAFGLNEKDETWTVGISNPDDRSKSLFYVPVRNESVATSGDYEQHFIYQGERYSHNISPKTGLPIRGIKSVSVFSPSAELSDALATGIYAMGVVKGLAFVNALPNTHCLIIDADNQVHFSKKIHYEAVS